MLDTKRLKAMGFIGVCGWKGIIRLEFGSGWEESGHDGYENGESTSEFTVSC
jgi:hypothetical protein